jgi:hypothetical protein
MNPLLLLIIPAAIALFCISELQRYEKDRQP